MEKELIEKIKTGESVSQLDLYNQAHESKYIDVFAEKHEKYTGIIPMTKEIKYFPQDVIGLIRLQTISIENILFNSVRYSYRDINNKKVVRIMPLLYWFSELHYLSTLIDIPVDFILNEPQLEFGVDSKTNIIVSLYYSQMKRDRSGNSGKFKRIDLNEQMVIHDDNICVTVENKTDKYLTNINIFNYFDNEKKCVITPIGCSYKKLLFNLDNNRYSFNNLKLASINKKQLAEPITINYTDLNGKSLTYYKTPNDYLNVNQIQNKIINMKGEFRVGENCAYIMNLHPYSKIRLLFY